MQIPMLPVSYVDDAGITGTKVEMQKAASEVEQQRLASCPREAKICFTSLRDLGKLEFISATIYLCEMRQDGSWDRVL